MLQLGFMFPQPFDLGFEGLEARDPLSLGFPKSSLMSLDLGLTNPDRELSIAYPDTVRVQNGAQFVALSSQPARGVEVMIEVVLVSKFASHNGTYV